MVARKTRDSRGFPLIFNGSDSEKRRRLPILEWTGLHATGRTHNRNPAWDRGERTRADFGRHPARMGSPGKR
ncbi:hypothetical protein FCJ61_40100 [Burkholderia metallica]|nr:hypothetical protein [Burkholderia metallica]